LDSRTNWILALRKGPDDEACRKHRISEACFYNWKAKYGGVEVSDAKRPRGLESENAKLKKLLADGMLDNAGLTDFWQKMVTPAAKREVASSDRTKKLAGADTLQVALQASGLNQVKILYRPRLLSDNGPSLMSSELADWLEDNGIGHIRGRLAAYDGRHKCRLVRSSDACTAVF
jgi:hypothetical protein